MPVTKEEATVYLGGGRRFLTLRSAIKAEARRKINSRKGDCGCDYCDHDELPGCPREEWFCRLHGERYEVALRRLMRIYTASYNATKE